jgi:putative membrane protein
VKWWCSTVTEPWSWSDPTWYFGAWLLVGGMFLLYTRAWRKRLRTTPGARIDRRKALWFGLALTFIWVASDWPVAPLGASYLATAHMLQYMLYTLAAAPLLVLGLPEWMVRRMLERLRLYRAYRWITRPLAAGITFNLILIATHAPTTVDYLRVAPLGSFVLDMAWLISGFILWSPVVSPLDEVRVSSPGIKLVYIFLACGVLPMIPGGFLTFSSTPLYGIYELAPRVGLDPLDDQQVAGVLMKIGNIPVIWTVMAVIWARWADGDRAQGDAELRAMHADEPIER